MYFNNCIQDCCNEEAAELCVTQSRYGRCGSYVNGICIYETVSLDYINKQYTCAFLVSSCTESPSSFAYIHPCKEMQGRIQGFKKGKLVHGDGTCLGGPVYTWGGGESLETLFLSLNRILATQTSTSCQIKASMKLLAYSS